MREPICRRSYRCPHCSQEFTIYEAYVDLGDQANQQGKCPACGFLGKIDNGTTGESPDFVPLSAPDALPLNTPPGTDVALLGLTNLCPACNTFLVEAERTCRACRTTSGRRSVALEARLETTAPGKAIPAQPAELSAEEGKPGWWDRLTGWLRGSG